MRRQLRWLLPGLFVKRWLFVSAIGMFIMGLGISLAVRGNLYASAERWVLRHITYSEGVFRWGPAVSAAVLIASGLVLTFVGEFALVRSVLRTLSGPSGGAAEVYYQKRFLVRGPKIVAVGGGTGIPNLLRGLKKYTSNITAVVTVSDDGGSSGRLRTEFGILPPGDIRNCLVALADTEPLMEKLFQHRFHHGNGLEGHPFGNLFILALTETTGNFYDAVRASSDILAIQGRVMPSTLDQAVLRAELESGDVLTGESLIGQSPGPIRRVYLEPAGGGRPIRPLEDALTALREADVIVLGPGSLYTSILPNLLVPGVAEAIRNSPAMKVYVCNIMTQPGETTGYTVSRHLQALIDHAGFGIVNVCVVNNQPISEPLHKKYLEQQAAPVNVDTQECQRLGVKLVQADLLLDTRDFVRHDPDKLARLIGRLCMEVRGGMEATPWDFFLLRQRLLDHKREESGTHV